MLQQDSVVLAIGLAASLAWLWGMRVMAGSSNWRLALVSLFGTWLHEMSHIIVGFVLNAKPASLSLLPRREGDMWVLGSASFTNLNLLNAAPVALAPLLLGGLGLWVVTSGMVQAWQGGNYGIWLLLGFLAASSFHSCVPSRTDLRVGTTSILFWAGIAVVAWHLFFPPVG